MSTLNSQTDRLNEVLRDVEDYFAGLGVGVPASVPVDEGASLAWKKHNGEWKLFVVLHPSDEEVPLLSAPRARRVQATAKLEDLEDAVYLAANKVSEEVDEAITRAVEFLASRRPV